MPAFGILNVLGVGVGNSCYLCARAWEEALCRPGEQELLAGL